MKLLHLGDLHLGKSLLDFDLIDDQEYMLNQILNIIKERNIDGVLLAGDIYDKAIPSEAATRLLDYFLNSLSKMGTKTFLISGNHDSDERLNFGSALFESNNIFISAKYDGTLYKQPLNDDYGSINIYLLPFVKASYVKRFFPEAEIETYEDAVKTVIQNANIDTSVRNVIVAHQFVMGHSDPETAGSEGLGTQTVGLVEKIGYDCFDAFDYVALGHIHAPQQVGRETVRYSGSMLKYSLSEHKNKKSAPIITLGPKGEVDIELVPLIPKRDLRLITGTLKNLLDSKNVVSQDDYLYVKLTDEEMYENVMNIFQQTYPRTLKVEYDNSWMKEITNVDISILSEKKPFMEIINEFYNEIYGMDIPEDEIEVMKEAAKEAGLLNETN